MTAITALVLFAVATAQVKGFALMLLIGTVISLVTAVVATRAMLGLLAGFRWFDNPRFMGATGTSRSAKWLQIDFMGRSAGAASLILATIAIAASVLLLAVKGLNLGIDFKGGTQISFNTPQAVSLSKVRAQTSAIGRSDAVVQGRGTAFGAEQVQELPAAHEVADRGTAGQADQESRGSAATSRSSAPRTSPRASAARSRVTRSSPSSSRCVLILIYITLRFSGGTRSRCWRTLFSDILITIGVYALAAGR